MRRVLDLLGLLTVLTVALPVALAGTWVEVNDAPDLPPGQVTVGVGSLDLITGTLDGAPDVDLYAIRIVRYSEFYASTVGLTSVDTRLFLFDANAIGVSYDDDVSTTILQSTITPQFLTHDGVYYLAIAKYPTHAQDGGGLDIWNSTPYTVERAPDGPGAANPLGGWLRPSGTGGAYGIGLIGAEFAVPPLCPGDMNCDGRVTFADIDLFVEALSGESAWNEHHPGCPWLNADCNGDSEVTFADIDPFVALIGTTCL